MKKTLKALFLIIAVIIIIAGCFAAYMTIGLKSGANLKINDVDISNIKDGEYYGNYKNGRWSNEVKVIVKDHKIKDINFTKDVTFSDGEVKQKLIKQVIDKQSLNVDAVSGATVTTKTYLKSIENALNNK